MPIDMDIGNAYIHAMETTHINRAADICGGASSLARAIGAKPPTVYQWLDGSRPVPLHQCPAIEAATSGAVRCEQLRPDVQWVRARGRVTHYKVSVQAAA